MTQFTATMNIPGYLPWDDGGPPVFGSAAEAWEYLAEQRREQEEAGESDRAYSGTVEALEAYAEGEPTGEANGTGTVHGPTPHYSGDHDLGIAYTVSACSPQGEP